MRVIGCGFVIFLGLLSIASVIVVFCSSSRPAWEHNIRIRSSIWLTVEVDNGYLLSVFEHALYATSMEELIDYRRSRREFQAVRIPGIDGPRRFAFGHGEFPPYWGRVMWFRFPILAITILTGGIPFLLVLCRLRARIITRLRLKSNRCRQCGYDLRFVEHLRCPECGYPCPDDSRSQRSRF